MNNRYLKDK